LLLLLRTKALNNAFWANSVKSGLCGGADVLQPARLDFTSVDMQQLGIMGEYFFDADHYFLPPPC
jgi:hypothetical protein